MRSLAIFTASIAAVGAFAGAAHADETQNSERKRAFIGTIGIGGGHLGCTDGDDNDCDGGDPVQAITVVGEAGLFVAPRVALVAHLEYTYHKNDDVNVTVSQSIAAAAVRGWVLPRVWLEGGLGVARASAKFEAGDFSADTQTDTVPAFVGGVGVDIISTPRFDLDINLRLGTGLYRDDISLYQTSLGVSASFF